MEQPADSRIATDILDTLAWDARLAHEGIRVSVSDGVVRLTGTVPTYDDRYLAAEDAWRVKGVREVVNELRVEPGVVRSDEEIARDVYRALTRDPISVEGLAVRVAGGVVHLDGVAPNLRAKLAALEAIARIAGVVDVVDDLSVSPTLRRPDAAIARDVEEALRRDARLSDARAVRVAVHDGIVVLDGAVASPTEREAALQIARFTGGVRDVVDRLRLAPAPAPATPPPRMERS